MAEVWFLQLQKKLREIYGEADAFRIATVVFSSILNDFQKNCDGMQGVTSEEYRLDDQKTVIRLVGNAIAVTEIYVNGDRVQGEIPYAKR